MTVQEQLETALADRYAIVREIGAGGMATVYLAEDLRHRRKVAIKVLHPELSAVIGSERFLKEIELTANLQHPHILPLFDSGDVNGQLYYVMPFVDGETLRSRLEREQQLPVADAIRIAREVADALAYAHKRGVVHRDVKPENVLLQDGHALVADFGIALAVQQAGAGRLTQTGLSLGTPQYMSPEQAMGERVIDQRADIYALGAVTYEMLAGEPPFTGPTAQAIIARAMTERPRDLLTVRETLPLGVSTAVMTALAKLPADRFGTASEFADALVRDGTTATRSVSMPAASVTRVRRAWVPWAALAAGLVVGAIAMRAWPGRAPGPGASADAPRFWSIALPDSAPFVAGHDPLATYVRSLDISPDGDRIVWTTQRDSTTALWQVRADLGTASLIPGTVGATIPTFSPDGKALAFASPGNVSRIDLATNAFTRIGSLGGYLGSMVALFWPTSDRIIAWAYSGCLGAVASTGGTFAPLAASTCSIHSVAHGPSADRLLVSTGSIGFLEPASGRIQYVRRFGASDTSANAFVAGVTPMLLGGALLFMNDSTLYGATIDVHSARLTSEPRQLVSSVRREAGGGGGQIVLSRNGTLVWASGGDAALSRFVFVRPNGGPSDTVATAPAIVNSFALSSDGRHLAYTVSLPGNRSVLHVVDLRRGVEDSTLFAADLEVSDWVDADSALAARVIQPRAGARRSLVIRGVGSSVRLDTTGASYASSGDGRMRCAGGRIWSVDSPRDSVRFNPTGNWCRFSPDGRYVSWDESDGLMIAPTTPNAASLRRRIGPPGANEPKWTADGRELMYRTGNRWYAVPSNPPADRPLPAPRLVVQGSYNQAYASWDLAPDGRLLLLQGAPAVRATHLNVITNFPRYVEERLKPGAR